MDENMKLVDFSKWCPQCKYGELPEDADPCWDCLAEPANVESTKPVKWKGKDSR